MMRYNVNRSFGSPTRFPNMVYTRSLAMVEQAHSAKGVCELYRGNIKADSDPPIDRPSECLQSMSLQTMSLQSMSLERRRGWKASIGDRA